MFSSQFPRCAFFLRASRTAILASSICLTTTAFGNSGTGTTKPAERPVERPVARLLSTSRQEIPPRVRERLIARISAPASNDYAPASASAAVNAATGDERRAFDLINAERRSRGLKALVWDGALTRMARYQSDNMARDGILNHVDQDGLDLTGRAELLGLHDWKTLGENIAYNQGYPDPTAFAVERWMVSSKHRENILNAEFTHAGLGIARAADGRIFFTQVFMKR
jgi:uncharacterized protein YkwD